MNRKVKVSLNIDRDMLERARQKDIDLDELFEHALRRYGCEDPEKAAAESGLKVLDEQESDDETYEWYLSPKS